MKAKYLQLATLATQAAFKSADKKHFLVGAAGIRADGAVVVSGNGPTPGKDRHAHAETRLCQKLDEGATVFVVRVRRDGTLANSRPCDDCKISMFMSGVRKVYYTNEEGEVERLW